MVVLISGPMFSGKSTELFQKMERYVYAKKKVLLVRPKKDTRTYFVHSNTETGFVKLASSKKIDIITISEFEDLSMFEQYDAIFVDEYFMLKGCDKLARHTNPSQDLYFAGLMATSECTLFEETINLLPYCDNIIKLNGVCTECGSQLGNYSYYRQGLKTSSIIVGDDAYTCLCKECYLKSQKEKEIQPQLKL